jgi:plastocyanin
LKSKLVICLAATPVAALLCWPSPGSGEPRALGSAKAHKVSVQDNFFDRRSVELAPNGKVVWLWKGANRHNVRFTKVPKGVKRGGSKTQTEGQWRRTFRTPGTYRYICKLYTGMRGTITVRADQPQPKTGAR